MCWAAPGAKAPLPWAPSKAGEGEIRPSELFRAGRVVSVDVALQTPVPAHGATIDKLTLREPTGADFKHCGFPFRDIVGGVVIDTTVVTELLSTIGGVPTSTIDLLTRDDYDAVMNRLLSFLNQTGVAPEMRLPTGRDLRLCGYPSSIGERGQQVADCVVVSRMIAALSGLDAKAVDALPCGDWIAAKKIIDGFSAASSPSASSPPTTNKGAFGETSPT